VFVDGCLGRCNIHLGRAMVHRQPGGALLEALGIRVGTAKSRLHRSLEALRKGLMRTPGGASEEGSLL